MSLGGQFQSNALSCNHQGLSPMHQQSEITVLLVFGLYFALDLCRKVEYKEVAG